VKWDFFCTAGHNSGIWSKIEVPSNWELQGYGNYNYGRDYKTNERTVAFMMNRVYINTNLLYQLPGKTKSSIFVFDGSMTDTEVKINGKSAGKIHQGAFYRFKYDISSLLFFDTTKYTGSNG